MSRLYCSFYNPVSQQIKKMLPSACTRMPKTSTIHKKNINNWSRIHPPYTNSSNLPILLNLKDDNNRWIPYECIAFRRCGNMDQFGYSDNQKQCLDFCERNLYCYGRKCCPINDKDNLDYCSNTINSDDDAYQYAYNLFEIARQITVQRIYNIVANRYKSRVKSSKTSQILDELSMLDIVIWDPITQRPFKTTELIELYTLYITGIEYIQKNRPLRRYITSASTSLWIIYSIIETPSKYTEYDHCSITSLCTSVEVMKFMMNSLIILEASIGMYDILSNKIEKTTRDIYNLLNTILSTYLIIDTPYPVPALVNKFTEYLIPPSEVEMFYINAGHATLKNYVDLIIKDNNPGYWSPKLNDTINRTQLFRKQAFPLSDSNFKQVTNGVISIEDRYYIKDIKEFSQNAESIVPSVYNLLESETCINRLTDSSTSFSRDTKEETMSSRKSRKIMPISSTLTGGSFNYIVEPITNKRFSIHSSKGKQILKNYLNHKL